MTGHIKAYAELIGANDNKIMPAYAVEMRAYILAVVTAMGQMGRPPRGFPDGVMTMDCRVRRELVAKGWELLDSVPG